MINEFIMVLMIHYYIKDEKTLGLDELFNNSLMVFQTFIKKDI